MMYVGRPVEAGQYIKGSKQHGTLPKGMHMGGSCDVRMGGQLCWATVPHAHLPSLQIVVVPDKHWVVLRDGQVQAVMGEAEFNQWYMSMATAAKFIRMGDHWPPIEITDEMKWEPEQVQETVDKMRRIMPDLIHGEGAQMVRAIVEEGTPHIPPDPTHDLDRETADEMNQLIEGYKPKRKRKK